MQKSKCLPLREDEVKARRLPVVGRKLGSYGVQSSLMRGTKPGTNKEAKAAGLPHCSCEPGHVHHHSANASGTNTREGKPFKVKDRTSTNPSAGYKTPSHQKPG